MAEEVRSVFERTAQSLVIPLQHQAQGKWGWPEELATSLTVEVTEDGDIAPTWPEERDEEIKNIEGGTPDQKERPALYSFFQSQKGKQDIDDQIDKQAEGLLKDLEARMFA